MNDSSFQTVPYKGERDSHAASLQEKTGEGLKERTAKGLLWGGFSNGVQQLLSLLFGIVLARLLSVEDYGMIGLLTIFSLIANSLQESGFTAALTNKKDLQARDYNAVFWFNILFSFALYAILFFSAPLIAGFYGVPELVSLSRYVFLGFFISSFGIVPNAFLFRNLMVKQKTLCSMVALVVSGCTGVTLAYLGFAYWGLATQTLAFISVQTAGYWYFSRWRPSLRIDFSPLVDMFGFSFRLLVTNVFNHVNNNLLSLVLGKFYSKHEVGLYNQAGKWSGMPQLSIIGMINGVAQPVLSSVTDEKERQLRIFRKMLRFASFLSFPVLFGLALIAAELIELTVGSKWLPCVPFLQLMCVSGAFVPLSGLYQQLVISKGKSDVFMWNIMASGLVLLGGVLLVRSWGMEAIVRTYVAVNVCWFPIWHHFAWKGGGFGIWRALSDVLPFALAAVLVMACTYSITFSIDHVFLRLAAKIVVAMLLYVCVMWMARVDELSEVLKYIRKKKNS